MGKGWANNDYCTHSPDKVFGVDISFICYEHDLNYMNHNVTRKQADKMLKERIIHELTINGISKVFSFIVGNLYFFGVRLFGKFYW